jgi:hypothetical protein
MGKNEAKAKVSKELAAYREATAKLSGSACYQRAPEIMFTEATADRLQHLCNDEELAALVEAGGTLEGCVKSIVNYCRKDIGKSGDISEDDFRACIKDYYRMPDKATESKPKQPAKTPEAVKDSTHSVPASKPVVIKPARKEPTILSTQLDMFGMLLQPAKTPEADDAERD